jgi:hypothetical protein
MSASVGVARCTSVFGRATSRRAGSGCAGAGGSSRRPAHRFNDIGVIPSRVAAWDRLGDVRIATSRSVSFSISSNDVAA